MLSRRKMLKSLFTCTDEDKSKIYHIATDLFDRKFKNFSSLETMQLMQKVGGIYTGEWSDALSIPKTAERWGIPCAMVIQWVENEEIPVTLRPFFLGYREDRRISWELVIEEESILKQEDANEALKSFASWFVTDAEITYLRNKLNQRDELARLYEKALFKIADSKGMVTDEFLDASMPRVRRFLMGLAEEIAGSDITVTSELSQLPASDVCVGEGFVYKVCKMRREGKNNAEIAEELLEKYELSQAQIGVLTYSSNGVVDKKSLRKNAQRLLKKTDD